MVEPMFLMYDAVYMKKFFERFISSTRDEGVELDTKERTHNFSYVDKNGNELASALIEAEPEKFFGHGMYVKKVKKWMLTARDEKGQEKKIDLVSFFQEASGIDIPIFIARSVLKHEDDTKIDYANSIYKSHVPFLEADFQQLEGAVLVSEEHFNEAYMIFAIAHEFGHEAQNRDPVYAPYNHLYKPHLKPNEKKIEGSLYEKKLEAIAGLLPKHEEEGMREIIEEYRGLTLKIRADEKHLLRLIEEDERQTRLMKEYVSQGVDDALRLSILEGWGRHNRETMKEIKEGTPARKRRAEELWKKIEPHLDLPSKVLERNATARGLLYMRTFYERYGIDFTHLYGAIDRTDRSFVDKCMSSMLAAIRGDSGSGMDDQTNEAFYERTRAVHKAVWESHTSGMLNKYGSIRSPGLEALTHDEDKR
jgi:hypothetical protein